MQESWRVLLPIALVVVVPLWGNPESSAPEKDRQGSNASQAVLQEYRARRAQKTAIVAAVEQQLGKPFLELTKKDYTRFMQGLDLNRDDDLWTWSHVTGIPIIGVPRKSTFFFFNVHLLEDVQAAVEMPFEEIVKLKRGYDPASDKLTIHTADGQALRVRDIPAGTVRRSARTGRLSHDEDFAEPRTVLEVLAPYLVTLGEIPNRQYITQGLQALPLSVVRVYRGKAIYLTTQPGRSYAIGMPVSNSVYHCFAGMQAGIFVEHRQGAGTTHNLVHELGHVIDYTVIKGRYGRYLHPYQFPEYRKLKQESDRIFGKGDSKVPQTDYGYVSRYSRANAQESFAEHFAVYILENERFHELARAEDSAGHPQLMAKYRFLETLLEETPVTMYRLSRSFLETLDE